MATRPINDRLEQNRAKDDTVEQEKHNEEEVVEEEEEEEEDLPNIVQVYYQKVPKEKLDKYFGVIMEDDGRYKMGNKYIQIVKGGGDFTIDGKRYTGTKGLWSLIMKRKPTDYSHQDLAVYQDVVLRTNVIDHPNNIEPSSRVTTTKKWREIFPLFIKEDIPQHHSGLETTEHVGEGIFFLPGDIKGLETKLNYLLGEYRAGNRSSAVRNEIVSILDELLRRKRISRKEYQDINTFLK